MRIRITLLLLAITLGLTSQSHAAFVIKKDAPTAQVTSEGAQEITVIDENTPAIDESTIIESQTATKLSFAHNSPAPTFGKARIAKWVYVLLTVIPLLAFLAVGLNDYFRGSHWILCMCLCLLIIPGMVYSFAVMKNYYHNKSKAFKY